MISKDFGMEDFIQCFYFHVDAMKVVDKYIKKESGPKGIKKKEVA